MSLKDDVVTFIVGAVYVAILYSMVRPGSKMANIVKTVSGLMIGLVATTTGYTQNWSLSSMWQSVE